MDPLIFINFESFGSVWFWLAVGVTWSMTCHWTVGVPFDALVRAHNDPEAFARDAEELARITARRVAHVIGRSGVVLTAVICFVLAVIATFAFVYGYEMAQAFFLVLAPLTLVHGLNVGLALKIARGAFPDGPALRKALLRRRFWNQVIGLTSIVIAVMAAFVAFARHTLLWD